MESKRNFVSVALAIGLLAMSAGASETYEISCPQALADLHPCKDYLMGYGPDQPPWGCCQNVEALYKQATTTLVRRDLCKCLKNAAVSMGVNFDRAKKLAPACKSPPHFPLIPKLIATNSIPTIDDGEV